MFTFLRNRCSTSPEYAAQVLALEAEHLFNRIEHHYMPKNPKIEIGLTFAKFSKHPDGTIEMEGVELDPDKADEELRLFKGLTQAPSDNTPSIKTKDSSTLEEVIEEYCEEKIREGSWTAKSEQENRAIYTLLVRILGNIPIDDITAAKARDYKHVLMRLPPNINKSPLYRSKTLPEILDMAPKAMSTTTVNKNIIRISSLFEWSSRHGYVNKNYFEGLVLKTKTRADEERSIFKKDDLKEIFKHEIFTALKYKHPYQYWLPLLGLYTGARLEELCQLYLEDIYNDEGIWVIDINNKGDKKLKTKSSKRIIPIHSKLQALGFIDYVESLRHKGESRLFPELKKGRDGYSQSASKWFSRLRKDLGLYNLDPPKDFHSFRHTLATELKNKGIPEPEVAAITGHSIAGITFSRYGKAYDNRILNDALDHLNYDDVLNDTQSYK